MLMEDIADYQTGQILRTGLTELIKGTSEFGIVVVADMGYR